MRIFVAAGIFHPESGGPSTYLYRLLPELQARGHEVRVLAFGDAPVDGYPYPLRRIPRRVLPLRWWAYARAARAELTRADVVFANSLGLPLPARSDVPRVLKVVGDLAWERAVNKRWIAPAVDIDAFQTRRDHPRVQSLKAQRSREVRRVDRVIVPSDYLRQMVIGWGADPARVEVIYNAIHVPHTADVDPVAVPPTEARARLGLDAGPLLLTVARLVAWKGIDYLIRGLRDVPDVRLLVAGDGPDAARLAALAASEGVQARVTFLGRVPREQMPLFYRAADYTVLYSGYEGLSHVLLESLCAGTPVIASDKSGNPEVVRHEDNGLLVPYIDHAALVAALRTAFDGDTRARLAARTGAQLDRFTWDTMVDRTLTALETAGQQR